MLYIDTVLQQEAEIHGPNYASENEIVTSTDIDGSSTSEDVEFWDVSDDDLEQGCDDNEIAVEQEAVKTKKWILLFLLLWSTCYGISANAVSALVSFLHYLLAYLAKYASVLAALASVFPASLYKVRKCFGLHQDNFVKFVVCPSCHAVYLYEDCYDQDSCGRKFPRSCGFTAYPQHPVESFRKECGHRLLKEVILSSGRLNLYPLKIYCYKGVRDCLASILNSKGKRELCELWRNQCVPQNTLADIYDGKIWKELKWRDGSYFFHRRNNIGIMLNCDWFPPFERTMYSVGVLYAVILNLPRAIRFKPENILIIGIIPGPSEPPLTMNSYLKPLTDELTDLWDDGLTIENEKFYVALICIACDRPAAHKIGGFLGHSSSHACSYCIKHFPYNKTMKKLDYSGFNVSPLRLHSDHKRFGSLWLKAKTQTERDILEKRHGSRFSQINLLPYFDSINQLALDPMHNLFEGTAKRVLKKVWLNEQSPLLQKKDAEKIHNTISSFKTPSSIGRLPLKVLSNFSSFTADQWKSWTLWFSLVCVRDLLPQPDYNYLSKHAPYYHRPSLQLRK